MVTLGSKVTDSISGFTGIATARVTHLYGCVRVEVQPDRLDEHGKKIEPEWFDEQRVDSQSEVTTGGDFDVPPRPNPR